MEKTYQHKDIEGHWYKFWEEGNYFHAEIDSEKERFSMVIPPPNITGSLHIGHALNCTLQDIIARFKRMQGYNTLWLPGTDHAGIATQIVVERYLKDKYNLSKDQLSAEEFLDYIWQWKEKHGNVIVQQLKRLGCSCDWQRLRFTMDTQLAETVQNAFLSLYKEGYIYRDYYIVNWCPRCTTALSDIEVSHREVLGKLYYINYPLIGGGFLTVATTRPETMLGDTAVCVHPDDTRYKTLIGKYCILPLVGRKLQIIADNKVKLDFGSGVLKVTPAHDFIDFEIAKRHNLEKILIMDERGRMNEFAGKYRGLERMQARSQILKDLKDGGYFVKEQDYTYALGHCYRCGEIIEPYLSLQWFMKMSSLSQLAKAALFEKKLEFVPKFWECTYLDWLDNIKDWCISRQILWGHRIPIWHCYNCNSQFTEAGNCKGCGEKLQQDKDVLDTWFSSALWPITTLGWLQKSRDFEVFYPTDVLCTGFDIIGFWVARMVMMCLKFTSKVPFKKVYVHALIRDEYGKKMSKSAGNVIDPMEIIERYGADALRFSLAILTIQGRDILLSQERIKSYRYFCNKIYNSARFILLNVDKQPVYDYESVNFCLADNWLIYQLNEVIRQVTVALDKYEFNTAASLLYNFLWHEYCDWYLEIAKLMLRYPERRRITQYLLVVSFDILLRLLHPFMPFITEELWQKLPIEKTSPSIMVSSWPKPIFEEKVDEKDMVAMEFIKSVVRKVRAIRTQLKIRPQLPLDLFIEVKTADIEELLGNNIDYISHLCNCSKVSICREYRAHKSAVGVLEGCNVYIPIGDIVDIEEERLRLQKEIERLENEVSCASSTLHNENFINKAPKDIVEEYKMRIKTLREHIQTIKDLLSFL